MAYKVPAMPMPEPVMAAAKGEKERQPTARFPFDPKQMGNYELGDAVTVTLKGKVTSMHASKDEHYSDNDMCIECDSVDISGGTEEDEGAQTLNEYHSRE